jgi:uncharacterized protein YdcH (DUF465 family)
VLKEAFMFEEQPQPEIDALIKSNPEFKQLYQRHKDLDKKVMDAELGVLPIDDTTLGQMKREKLAAKDRLIQHYDQQHCSPSHACGPPAGEAAAHAAQPARCRLRTGRARRPRLSPHGLDPPAVAAPGLARAAAVILVDRRRPRLPRQR